MTVRDRHAENERYSRTRLRQTAKPVSGSSCRTSHPGSETTVGEQEMLLGTNTGSQRSSGARKESDQ